MFENYKDKKYYIHLIMYTTTSEAHTMYEVKITEMNSIGVFYINPVNKEPNFVPFSNIALIKEII